MASLRSVMQRNFFRVALSCPSIGIPKMQSQPVKGLDYIYAGHENGVFLKRTRPGNFELRRLSVKYVHGLAPSC